MNDIVIIGAGVVGGLIARELARYELDICILEAGHDVAMGATRANSAIVHAGFDAVPGSLKAKLNVRGSEMMEQVTRELGVKYRRNGSLVVGFDENDRETLLSLKERGEKNGVKGLEIVEGDRLAELEPNIGEAVKLALYAPTGAITCPYGLCVAAIGNAMDNGATLRTNFKVIAIKPTEGGYRLTSEKGETVEARYVINCAGTFSDAIAAMIGDVSFTVTPRRGEYMLLDRECGELVSHTVFRCPSKMGKGILVSPTIDGNLLLGPTAEDIEDKECVDTTSVGAARIRTQAGEQVKGIEFGKIITAFAGIRSTGSTGDFIINMPREGFVNVAGIESPGLSASPAIAEYVVEMLIGNGMKAEKKASFDPCRRPMDFFRELDTEGKNALIAERPEYAHIICRCETVTEGEIVDAIRMNPRPTDIDGVKRRTRASMGRCQGGFCMPHITEILARELGCAYEEITKFGGESYINIGKTKSGI